MTFYSISNATTANWPPSIEKGYQMLGGERGSDLAPKLPHLGTSDILFLAALMNLPSQQRQWGLVTWLSKVFRVSRPSLYALKKRVFERLSESVGEQCTQCECRSPIRAEEAGVRMARTVLTASGPGKMAIRPLQQVLCEAFDQERSMGWISELVSEAGRRAGTFLSQVDTSTLGTVIVARDETFFHGIPILMVIEPVSMTVLFCQACPDRQADTWGAALLMVEEKGVTIGGIVEDMARMYDKSRQEAELDVLAHKDSWHLQRDGTQVLRDLERAALRATKQVLTLEKKLCKQWDDDLFETQYVPAVAKETQLYDQYAAFADCLTHFIDALEVVDWRNGDIRDRQTSDWLLEETLQLMAAIDHARVNKWVKTLRNHQKQLLTALDWLQASLDAFLPHLHEAMTPQQAQHFLRTVARHWRLQQALINGHSHLQVTARHAQQAMTQLCHAHLHGHPLAKQLLALLDAACRTSSLIECVNGLLKQFLHNHRAFAHIDSLQLRLNLFTLWHNTRIFQRGKRAGSSPYRSAGIEVGSDDWLTLIGFPPTS